MTGTMIDCIGSDIPALLQALGSNNPDTFATYVTGSGGVFATPGELSELGARAGLLKYDQSPGLTAFGQGLADAADIEMGAGTFDGLVPVTAVRESKGWWSWWYFQSSSLSEAESYVNAHSFKRVRYIVADWNLSQAEAQNYLAANADVDAVQWASPTSNPNTICPGTSRTLQELNVDLNVTRPAWFIKPVAPPAPVPKYRGVVVTESLGAISVTSNDQKTWAA